MEVRTPYYQSITFEFDYDGALSAEDAKAKALKEYESLDIDEVLLRDFYVREVDYSDLNFDDPVITHSYLN